jgi:preprotein translocase subunit SecE
MAVKLFEYIKQSKDELKKVVWPTKKEVIRNTLMVIGISLFVAVFLGLLDIALSYGLKQIL